MHELFSVDASQIDLAMVQDFLALRLRESFTVDYKRKGTDKILEAVAAMANTYGGLVLVGVAQDPTHGELPGPVVGVDPGRKTELVNQMGSQYDPPWSPEVIDVPIGEDDKVVLVIRIDAALAPRPIVLGGRVQVRLDGRDIPANRQLIQALLDENRLPETANVVSLRRGPKDHRHPIRRNVDDPDVAARVITSVPLWPVRARPRLGPKAVETIINALDESSMRQSLWQMMTMQLKKDVTIVQFLDLPGLKRITEWAVDGQRISSQERCVSAGSPAVYPPFVGRPGIRVDCTIAMSGNGSNRKVEALIDTLFWLPRERRLLPMEIVVAAFRVAVPALMDSVLPAMMQVITGYRVRLPRPQVELYLDAFKSTAEEPRIPLDKVVDLGWLGERAGIGEVWHGAVLLDEELAAAGKWEDATDEALTVMAEDWGYLSPNLG
jgi:Predicted transcriptional regulator containing an HTH domain and an uncharacterized domain shared with the mammalian protein Schlafen